MEKQDADWYITEWMRALGLRNADLERRTGWDKRKVSFLVNGRQSYSRETLSLMAAAMGIQPFELLMHPESARSLHMLHGAAVQIASSPTRPWLDDASTDEDWPVRAN